VLFDKKLLPHFLFEKYIDYRLHGFPGLFVATSEHIRFFTF